EHDVPLEAQEVGYGDERAGNNGHVATQLVEDGGELRHDAGEQEPGHGEGDNEHHGGVGKRGLDLAAQRRLLLHVRGDAVEDAVEVARHFACAHEVDVQLVEQPRVLG